MTTFRPIAIGDEPQIKVEPGQRPDQQWLPLNRLVIDDDYQRPLARANWTQIRKIAANFKWSHFGCVDVAPIADGRFSVIDGQHRCHAAMLVGCSDVPCLIKPMSQQDQARAFTAINGQVTAVSQFHKYRAALTAMEPWAVTCEKVTSDAGCKLMTHAISSQNRKAGQLLSIGLIKSHVNAGRGAMISKALSALWAGKSANNPKLWANAVLKPWLFLLQENPRALTRDLNLFVEENDLIVTQRKVDRLHATDKYKGQSRHSLFNSVLAAQMNVWLADGGGK